MTELNTLPHLSVNLFFLVAAVGFATIKDAGRLWLKLKSTLIKFWEILQCKLNQSDKLKFQQIEIDNQILQSYSRKQLQKCQQLDPELSIIYKWILSGNRPQSDEV